MKNTNQMSFRYKHNGDIDFLKFGTVKTIFDVMIKYCDEITDEQLEDLVDEYKELRGEDLDFTQAKETLAVEMTKRYINEELDRRLQKYLSAKKGEMVSDSGE